MISFLKMLCLLFIHLKQRALDTMLDEEPKAKKVVFYRLFAFWMYNTDQCFLSDLCILGFGDITMNNSSIRSDQIRSVVQSCPTLCDPMNRSTPGLPVHHQLLEFTQTHVHWVIQPSHPLSSPSPLAPNPSQHQSLFQWVNSLHEVAQVLEFQL